jgi:uncharacterized protein YndB with AHSA1/START domain
MPVSDHNGEPVAEREVVITRVFDAPARLLFTAYSTPEHVMKWFGPAGWPLTLCEMDFRIGGHYRFAMTGPDGTQGLPFGGKYLEIVPNQKIVYSNALELPGAETMFVTITFDEDEQSGQTKLTIHTLFASVAMKNAHLGRGYDQGVVATLDQLADVVATLPVESPE